MRLLLHAPQSSRYHHTTRAPFVADGRIAWRPLTEFELPRDNVIEERTNSATPRCEDRHEVETVHLHAPLHRHMHDDQSAGRTTRGSLRKSSETRCTARHEWQARARIAAPAMVSFPSHTFRNYVPDLFFSKRAGIQEQAQVFKCVSDVRRDGVCGLSVTLA